MWINHSENVQSNIWVNVVANDQGKVSANTGEIVQADRGEPSHANGQESKK